MEDFSKYNGEGTPLRKAQLRMLEIMLEIDRICKKNNIEYWIDFGTLLGAKRHGGFIPWDDDVDVSVRRKDYKRLRKALLNDLSDKYFLMDDKVYRRVHFKGYSRVVDKHSYCHRDKEGADLYSKYDKIYNNGVFVDIWTAERGNCKVRDMIESVHGRTFRRIRRVINDGFAKRLIAYILYPFCALAIGCFRLKNRIFPSKQVCFPFGTPLNYRRCIDDFFPLSTIEFEGHTFSCPRDVDAYLRHMYGDYMQVPDEQHRAFHSYQIDIY